MPKKRLQYRYTATGQRSLMIDPDGGRFTYSYDSVKRLTQVLNPQGQRTSFAYDSAGRRTVKVLANGSRTSFSYDLANRITSVAQLKSDASVQARYDYKYDKAGNRTAMAETGATTARTTWTYDAAYQLTGEHRTGTNAFRHTYTYDTRGNGTLKNLDGARTTSSYDAANQLKWTDDGSGRTTYTFDADGNQQVVLTPAGQRTTSVWDYENKLTGVLYPSGARETMAYDPDGRRVKHQATDTAKYVWDQENYLAETNASDVTQAVYTNEPRTYGNLISQRKSGATHYYLFDALGSTRLLTDSSESVAEGLVYDAWGNLVSSSPSMTVPFRWVGQLGYLFVPASGDYYVRARVYRPAIGRWVSQDPLGFRDGTNRYVYVAGRLLAATDPNGMALFPPVVGPVLLSFNPNAACQCPRCRGGSIDRVVRDNYCNYNLVTDTAQRVFTVFARFEEPDCDCCSFRQLVKSTVRARVILKDGSEGPNQVPIPDNDFHHDVEQRTGNYMGSLATARRHGKCGMSDSDAPGYINVNSQIVPAVLQLCDDHADLDAVEYRITWAFKWVIVDICQPRLGNEEAVDGAPVVVSDESPFFMGCTLRITCNGGIRATDHERAPILPIIAE